MTLFYGLKPVTLDHPCHCFSHWKSSLVALLLVALLPSKASQRAAYHC